MLSAAVLCCATATIAFTSCGDDDSTTPPTKDTKAVAMKGTATLAIPQVLLDNYDIKVEYSDGKTTKSGTVNTTTYSAPFQATLPANLAFKCTASLKTGKELSSVKISDDKIKFTPSAYLVNAAGENLDAATFLPYEGKLSSQDVSDALEIEYAISFDDNGGFLNYRSSDAEISWIIRGRFDKKKYPGPGIPY